MLRELVVLIVIFNVVTPRTIKCGKNERWYQYGVVDVPCNRKLYVLPHKYQPPACGCKRGYKRGPEGCQLPGPGCT
ncbi:hypothetical protein V3C99_003649 [Haemonchus contortus]|nr:unnamed protein product [Haemonchus contortus]